MCAGSACCTTGTGCAGITLGASIAFITFGTGCACGTSSTGRTLFTCFALGALDTLYALNTLRASCALGPLLALYALRALRASHTDGLRCNGGILDGKGHDAAGIYRGNNNGACQALVTLRPLLACVAFLALRAGIAFQAGDDGLLAVIGHSSVGKLHAAALRGYCPVRLDNDVAGGAGRFPCYAIFAGFQHLVIVQADVLHIAGQDPLFQLFLYGRCRTADILCAHVGGSGQGIQRVHQAVVRGDHYLAHDLLYGILHLTGRQAGGRFLSDYTHPVAIAIGKYSVRGISIAIGRFYFFKHILPPVFLGFSVLYGNVFYAKRLRIAIGEAEAHFIKVAHIQLSAQHLRSCIGTPCPFRPVYILP